VFRFLALIWDSRNSTEGERVSKLTRRMLTTQPPWHTVIEADGLRVFCVDVRSGSSESYLLASDAGVVLGTLFRTHSKVHLNARASAEIVDTAARALLSKYWGRYVAFVRGPKRDRVWVVRDPSGRLPCFILRDGGVTFAFSHVADILSLQNMPLTLNERYLRDRLAFGPVQLGDTGLNEVSELHAGECLEVRDVGLARSLYWSPFELPGRQLVDDPEQAVHLLHDTVMSCTHAWASCYSGILLRLSGGLDSSVVLGCMAKAPSRPRITCVTYCSSGGISAERVFARRALGSLAYEHIERIRDPHVDFRALLSLPPSVNPAPSLSFLETSRFEQALASEKDAGAVCTGDGGDSLFGSLSKNAAADDYLQRRGINAGLVHVALKVALLSNVSIWAVLATAIRRRWQCATWDAPATLLRHRKFVSEEFLEPIDREDGMGHPWLRSMSGVARGTAMMVLGMLAPCRFYDPLRNAEESAPDELLPLLSQPVMELCLSIPTETHIFDGRDRGVARAAFASEVPLENLRRQWKDRGPGFYEAQLQCNLGFAREFLLDGSLMRRGMLKRGAVEEALSGSPTRSTGFTAEIFDHLLIEAWVRRWEAAAREASAVAA
jgi:asparagine synthase (glutamine-hydrolysing)